MLPLQYRIKQDTTLKTYPVSVVCTQAIFSPVDVGFTITSVEWEFVLGILVGGSGPVACKSESTAPNVTDGVLE